MAPMPEESSAHPPKLGFSVSHQKVELEIDLLSRSLKGRTELTINPDSKDLRRLRLSCRQCKLIRLRANGRPVDGIDYQDPYERRNPPWKGGVHQFHMLQTRLEKSIRDQPEEEMVIILPKNFRIDELDPSSDEAQSLLLSKALGSSKRDSDVGTTDLTKDPKTVVEQTGRFTSITLVIEYEIKRIWDGMHFVGFDEGDLRYPHAYTTNSILPGNACCLFPCIDDPTARCTWEISISCAKTIGDAFRLLKPVKNAVNGIANGANGVQKIRTNERADSFSDEDRALELNVLCSGEVADEVMDTKDPSMQTCSFICSKEISAQHVGFCIGPFEQVDLASFRGSEEDDRLGQQAVAIHGYCLPHRTPDLNNTCFPITQAIDYFTFHYGSFPFSYYQLCFVDDAPQDVHHTSALSICSSRLLFPEDVLDPIETVTRQLVHALASQWIGIDIVAKDVEDIWAVVGIAYFMTDSFMKTLFGRNDHRYRQKRMSDQVVELDVNRPSLVETGPLLGHDPSYYEFLTLKAPLVLFILDQRILKTGNTAGLSRIISRIFLNAKVGDLNNGALDTAYVTKWCEKLSHTKLDEFFEQWIYRAGCPRFRVTQQFNKKKLVVEMTLRQQQDEQAKDTHLRSDTLMREIREEQRGVFRAIPPFFTGPMTIRIHEADGTPYEHIVEIKEREQKFDIPYNTKYKRLKRNRRHKERTVVASTDLVADEGGDTLLYSLGDVLQGEDDMKDWRLADWGPDDEERMSQESYEWIRMDADFEWICSMNVAMPGYMWMSQLQQDRDVVAQLESIQYLQGQQGHPLISTFLIRTLMDQRYFHGIRTSAALLLARSARDEADWIGLFHLEKAFQELFCYPNSSMTKPNDFSDRGSYLIQCAVPQAVAKVCNASGHSTYRARHWLYEKLKYNDNGDNEYSDGHYIAILIRSLSNAMSIKTPPRPEQDLDFDAPPDSDDQTFQLACLEEIDRHRRLDEWIPSYQNTITLAALDAKALLIKTSILPLKASLLDFLQYTSDSTSETLRLTAFSHLMSLGQISHPHILRWFLSTLATDPSPRIRNHLILILARTLGAVAIGEFATPPPTEAAEAAEAQENGGLIVETETSTAPRAADFARKTTIAGALKALKADLGDNEVLKEGLWAAISSPTTDIRSIRHLLEFCDWLYEPDSKMVFVVRFRPYWRCRKVGKGKVVFEWSGRFKTKPPVRKKQVVKLKLGGSGSGVAASREGTLTARASPAGEGIAMSTGPVMVKRESSAGLGGAPRPFLKPPKPQPSLSRVASGSSVESVMAGGGAESPVGEGGKPKLKIKFKGLGGGGGGGGGGGSGSPQ